jgi:hypothetical protein
VATCGDPQLAPTFEEPTPVEPPRASLLLLPADGATLGELIAEVTIEVPESGQSVGSFDLWAPGELSEPALIHVDGSLELDDTHVPIAQVLNEGAVAYYLANGDLVYRLVEISFFAVSPGGQLQFQPVGPLEPEGPVVLEDPAAASHGRRVVWSVSEQFSTGFNISDGDPPFCFIIIGFLCHIVTPFETEQGTERPLRGSIQIRAHRVGDEGEDVEEVEIRIVHAAGANPEGSFLLWEGEDVIELKAQVTPPELGDHVIWGIRDNGGDQVVSVPPEPETLPRGAEITWRVPREQDVERWRRFTHPGTLDQKSLAFRVVAVVEDAGGERHESEPAVVRQDEIDTIRQEYVDIPVLLGEPSLPVPGRELFRPPPDFFVSFPPDYDWILFHRVLEGVVEHVTAGLVAAGERVQVNSLYRPKNPPSALSAGVVGSGGEPRVRPEPRVGPEPRVRPEPGVGPESRVRPEPRLRPEPRSEPGSERSPRGPGRWAPSGRSSEGAACRRA